MEKEKEKEVVGVVESVRPNGSMRVVLHTGKGKVQQHHRDQVDAKKIMAKFEKTGVLPPFKEGAVYGDVSEIGDYQEAMTRVTRAQEAFGALPAHVRDRFKNEPAALLEFVSDRKNLEEAIKLGIVEAAPQQPEVPPPGETESAPPVGVSPSK